MHNFEIAIQSYKNRDFNPKEIELGIAPVNILYQIIVQFNSLLSWLIQFSRANKVKQYWMWNNSLTQARSNLISEIFFLKHAGELRIFVLRKWEMVKTNYTAPQITKINTRFSINK